MNFSCKFVWRLPMETSAKSDIEKGNCKYGRKLLWPSTCLVTVTDEVTWRTDVTRYLCFTRGDRHVFVILCLFCFHVISVGVGAISMPLLSDGICFVFEKYSHTFLKLANLALVMPVVCVHSSTYTILLYLVIYIVYSRCQHGKVQKVQVPQLMLKTAGIIFEKVIFLFTVALINTYNCFK